MQAIEWSSPDTEAPVCHQVLISLVKDGTIIATATLPADLVLTHVVATMLVHAHRTHGKEKLLVTVTGLPRNDPDDIKAALLDVIQDTLLVEEPMLTTRNKLLHIDATKPIWEQR